jgi:uncharacterized membrane protein YedE/YeeE
VKAAFAFGCGVLFAVGLALAGMTNPPKVIAFLDVAGHWDPTLAFVMGSALAVYALAWRLRRRSAAPLLGAVYPDPPRGGIDARLLGGAAIFGVGWGIGGYCPGPAIASLTVSAAAPVFVVAMLVGMAAAGRRERLETAAESC